MLAAFSRRGIEVELFGGGDAADLLAGHPRWKPRSSLRPGVFSVPTLACHTLRDVAALRRARPHLVLSDGDQPALCAARLLGIPSVAVGHDLALTACELPARMNPVWRWHQRVNAWPAYVADRLVAVHFLPARALRPNVVVARPDCVDAGASASRTRGGLPAEFVLCYFRDANGARVVQLLAAAGVRVVWFGREARAAPGVWAYPFADDAFRAALRCCAAVIASSGSNLLAECVALHKPMLALHHGRDYEQALNAELAERADVAQRAKFEAVSARDVEHFLTRVRAQSFAQVELASALPPVSDVVVRSVLDLMRERYAHAAASCA